MPRFQWNDEKNRTNKAKHSVSFETACLIWNDPQYLLIPDAVYDGEQKWLADRHRGFDDSTGCRPCHPRCRGWRDHSSDQRSKGDIAREKTI
ncbi:BrnT family toxin [Rhizobium leguminosarum]|uniref:BrnT family toxin n=1 Tax=Rhizobium leguminosarum TaxID=384 RepID=UPI003F9715FC